jgi:signal transduction histidine kinase
MIHLPIKKVAGLLWVIFVISCGLTVAGFVLASRGELPRYVTVSFAVLGAGAMFLAFVAYRGMSALKKGLIFSIQQLKQQFDKRGEYLHATEKMATLGRLAAGVAHEIRNPLTSIKMRLFSLGQEFQEDSPQKEDVDVIKEEVDRLEDIVQNFLRFARPPEVKLEPASVSEILGSVVELLRHRFESQEIRVGTDQGGDRVMVLADRQQLRQVFMNILLNACDALPDGGDIRISYGPVEGGGPKKMVRVTIGNSGPSISSEDAAGIFEPFFSTRDEGTGLGLSIARQIVEQHGGEIKLDEPADGLPVRFSITLPAAAGEG